MLASEIIACLERLAPPPLQESYDNSGLLVGNAQREVKGVLVSLDCTEAVIDDAIRQGCDMVVCHHPIIFSGLKRLNGANYIERTVMKAIKEDVLIYAIHTNLDNVRDGVNRRIAERIGILDTQVLAPVRGHLRKLVTYVPTSHAEQVRSALWQAGAGHIGHYDLCSFNVNGKGTFRGDDTTGPFIGRPNEMEMVEEVRIEVIYPKHIETQLLKALRATHPYEEVAYDLLMTENVWQDVGAGLVGELPEAIDTLTFLSSLKEKMNTACVRHTPILKQKVKRIAVCGGAGSFLIKDAIRARADVLVTSDIKYHQFFDADGRLVIADIGHFESEQFTIDLLVDHLKRQFPTFATRFPEVTTNPINYL
jgi:dinuclear metal center YbgI/SA1388 family protein